ncbi:MAG: hypothetical protein ACI8SG_000421 [Marinobacter psychrophilus]|jgi:hypothetical protein
MSEAFWGFVKRNWRADVRTDLQALHVLMLALFGSHDAYVDPESSADAYRQLLGLSAVPFFEVRLFNHGDHGLIKTEQIKPAHQSAVAWLTLLKIWFLEGDISADGVLDSLANWLDKFPKPGIKLAHEDD